MIGSDSDDGFPRCERPGCNRECSLPLCRTAEGLALCRSCMRELASWLCVVCGSPFSRDYPFGAFDVYSCDVGEHRGKAMCLRCRSQEAFKQQGF